MNTKSTLSDYLLTRIDTLPLRDDKNFIIEQLQRFPSEAHNQIWKEYCYQWHEGKNETDVSYKKQNRGRHRANLWLLDLK